MQFLTFFFLLVAKRYRLSVFLSALCHLSNAKKKFKSGKEGGGGEGERRERVGTYYNAYASFVTHLKYRCYIIKAATTRSMK